jgi:CRISPR-associated exonuclease Cas4
MQEGQRQHDRTEVLEARHTLQAYGLTEGERQFRVRLHSPRLELSGVVDMVIETPTEVIPVDFKFTEGDVARNHVYQLVAYALLLEEQRGVPARRGFIYLVPQRRAREVVVTTALRRRVAGVVAEIRAALDREELPSPTVVRARHVDCEFLPRCGDVDAWPPPRPRD